MVLLRIYFQRVAAHECIDELGQRELVEFRDLNVGASAFQRTFSGDIKRCDELQRRLRFLAEQVEQVLPGREAEGRTVLQSGGAGASRGYTGLDGGKESWQAQSLEELERHLGSLERDVLDMNVHWDAMRREHSDLVEFGYVLELGATLFADAASPRTASALYGTLDLIEGARGEASVEDVEARPEAVAAESTGGRQTLLYGSVLSLFAGTVDTEHAEAFARLLFRASRGNCFTRFMNIPDKVHDVDANEDKLKSVFVLLFPGTELRAKVGRICEAFGGKRYAFPDEEGERRRLLADVRAKLAELQAVIESTHAQRVDVLGDIAANLESWSARIYRDKAIYYTLDQLNYDMSQRLFVGECWALGGGGAAHRRCTADAVSHQQIHRGVAEYRRGVRHTRVQGDESGAVVHRLVPVSVRGHVWRRGTRHADDPVRRVYGAARATFRPATTRRSDADAVRRPLYPVADGRVLHIHRPGVQ
eukprot:ctg_285.g180